MTIRIITEPSVFLLGRQSVDQHGLAAYLDHVGAPEFVSDGTSDAEKIVEIASRGCYQSYKTPRPGGNAAHIAHVLEVGHGSVTEHAVWTVAICGVSRSLTHELVRHRVGISPSQLSQRFVDGSDCAFVMPPTYAILRSSDMVRRAADAQREAKHAQGIYGEGPYTSEQVGELAARWNRWTGQLEQAVATYIDQVRCLEEFHPDILAISDKTLRRKRAREAARSVLPNCTETRIVLTGNARAWRAILEMRGDIAADLEFIRLAVELARLFKAEAPHLFADVDVAEVGGTECVNVKHRKV